MLLTNSPKRDSRHHVYISGTTEELLDIVLDKACVNNHKVVITTYSTMQQVMPSEAITDYGAPCTLVCTVEFPNYNITLDVTQYADARLDSISGAANIGSFMSGMAGLTKYGMADDTITLITLDASGDVVTVTEHRIPDVNSGSPSDIMTLDEKASLLNKLLIVRYPKTKPEGDTKLSELIALLSDASHSAIWYVIENLIWSKYELYYRSYRDFQPLIGHTVDVDTLEREIDTKIASLQQATASYTRLVVTRT